MGSQHPATLILPQIHEKLQTVTPELLRSSHDQALKVTLLLLSGAIALDATLHPTAEEIRLTSPFPVVLVGGINPDGSVDPSALGITTCRCGPSVHGSPRWNPLCLTLMWFPELPPLLPTVTERLKDLIVRLEGEFCPGGLQLLRITRRI